MYEPSWSGKAAPMLEDPTHYRSEEEAKALRPAALAWVQELEKLLPADQFQFNYGTLFVARDVEEEIVTMLVSVPGYEYAITALQFPLTAAPDVYADSIIRWRDTAVKTNRKWEGREARSVG